MNCRRMELLLSKERDGRLSTREAARVALHLARCPACRQLRQEFEAVGALMRAPMDLPTAAVDRLTLARWLEQRQTASSPNARHQGPGLLAATALALWLAALGIGRWQQSTRSPARHRVAEGFGTSERSLALPAPRDHPRKQMPTHRFGPSDFMSGVPQPAIHNSGPESTGNQSGGSMRAPAPAVAAPFRGVLPGAAGGFSLRSPAPRSIAAHSEHRRGTAVVAPLSPDDLAYMNQDPTAAIRRWAPLTRDEYGAIEARVRRIVRTRDDFIQIPFPRLASTSERQIAEAVEAYKRAAAVVDPRLSHEVSLQFKGTALADVCSRLRTLTSISLTAGPSVADEKVTLFCERMPLRDVMRQLSRPFGYTWLRSSQTVDGRRQSAADSPHPSHPEDRPPSTVHRPPSTVYRYELVQDLRSQLLEEELRNRDRNAALLALDGDLQKYRPYLNLSMAEAEARAKSAGPAERGLLEQYSTGWGPIQMYFRLAPRDMSALRAGETLTFSAAPGPGEQLLPPDLVRQASPTADSLAPVLRHQIKIRLRIHESELGEYTLGGSLSRPFRKPGSIGAIVGQGVDHLAVGISPSVLRPDNAVENRALARDPAFRARVSVRPQPSCIPVAAPGAGGKPVEPKVTTADVLEALHEATHRPIVADFYTRLSPARAVTVVNQPLFEALNQIADTMHLRWRADGDWLQFRSASYAEDRLKEVPNRLLARWAAARRQEGSLPLDGLLEMAQLSDTQLDAADMAEGARDCWGLAEWDLARDRDLRPHWRFLASFTPAQRQVAMSEPGLPFTHLTPPQQRLFLAFAFGTQVAKPEELDQATVRFQYMPQGRFQWAPPGQRTGLFEPPPVCEPTRAAALQAARRIDPQASEAQIRPTEWSGAVAYILGPPNHRYSVAMVSAGPNGGIIARPPGADEGP